MIIIVEDLLSQTINAGLKAVKEKPDIVDRLFAKSSITMRNRLKEYLKTGTINVIKGFPKGKAELPAYVILLGAEREEQQNLGDYVGDEDEFETLEDVEETHKIYRYDERFVIQTRGKPIVDVTAITYKGEVHLDKAHVIDADKGIVAIDNSLNPKVSDEITIQFERKASGTETFGTLFNSQYRIETWTGNGDLTVMLYHLLKWMLLSRRNELAQSGLVKQVMGGLDFEPSPEFMPEFVYRRALTFDISNEIMIDEEANYISEIIDESGYNL